MNRDKAIEIAASCEGWTPHSSDWASNVVDRADALLAAMGEQPRACDGGGVNWRCSSVVRYVGDFVVNLDGTKHTCAIPSNDANPDPVEYCDDTCCAATEARVVAEIAEWARKNYGNNLAGHIERGDWRAKEPVR